jgi:hypothetical protein
LEKKNPRFFFRSTQHFKFDFCEVPLVTPLALLQISVTGIDEMKVPVAASMILLLQASLNSTLKVPVTSPVSLVPSWRIRRWYPRLWL